MPAASTKPATDSGDVKDDPFGDDTPSQEPKAEAPAAKPVKTPAITPPPKMNVRDKPPPALPKELEPKKAMTKYVAQHGFEFKDYENLNYSPVERKAYTDYKSKHNREVPKELFTAALRMWHAGPTPGSMYPIEKPSNASLDELAIKD